MLKHMRFLIIFICLFFSFTVQAKPEESFLIGTSGHYPPFIMKGAKQSLYGFDIALMHEVCSLINVQCQFRQLGFAQLERALITNQIDMAIAAITITKERLKKLPYSIPYTPSHAIYLTKPTFKQEANRGLLEKKYVGVQSGTLFEGYLSQNKYSSTTIKPYRTTDDLLNALNKEQVDLIILDKHTAIYWAQHSSGQFKIIDQPINIGMGLGIALSPRRQAEYLSKVNQAILTIQSSGKLIQLYKMYFPTATTNDKLVR